IIGVLYTSAGFGTLIGPSAVGFVFDATHSYTLAIWISVGGNIIAAVIMAITARPAASISKP
ncbi:MAG TPA: MFS transporter, partial [Xanthobacteraceae bacterium]